MSYPGLPGCWSQGETESAALENIGTTIQEYLGAVKIQILDVEACEVEVTV